jgi:hypothetical protein
MPELNINLPDLLTGLPQALTEENSDIAGRGLGIVLAGRRFAGDGPTSWRVIVFRGLGQYDPFVVWDIWKEVHKDGPGPFRDVWQASNGHYVSDMSTAEGIMLGVPGFSGRQSPAL